MQGELERAESLLRAVLELDANDVAACQGLVALSEARGDLAQAIRWQQRCLDIQLSGTGRYNLARLLARQGEIDSAIKQYQQAIEAEPGLIQAYNNLGNLLLRQGRFAQAIETYQQGLALAPEHADLPYNLGLAMQKAGRKGEARKMFLRALQQAPSAADVMLALGTLAHEAGVPGEAESWYRKACQTAPEFIEAHFNLGKALHDLNRIDEAIDAYRAALALNPVAWGRAAATGLPLHPRLAKAHFNLGRALLKKGRLQEWIANYHAWTIQGMDLLNVQYALEVADAEGNFRESASRLAELVEHARHYDDVDQMSHLLSLAQWMDIEPSDLFRLYRRYDELARVATCGEILARPRRSREGRRVRIGYLSPDFNDHVMGRLMHEVLSRHDKDRFQVHLYALRDKRDELNDRFRVIADSYASVGALTARQAAERIAHDDLDVLVDLAGHTSGARPLILAYRPAPVQVTHLGYHGALGLSAVDYKITDRFADLPENADYMIEKLLPMAGCLMPFQHQDPALSGMTRKELGVDDDSVVFGAFVGGNKLSERCLQTWREILEKTANGILAFSPSRDWQRQWIRNRTFAAGISSERILFIPRTNDYAADRARYRLVDIVLDTFPYTGGDTTMAALDMAVPVVTLCGRRQSERVSFSILKNLGVEAGITYTEADYVHCAVRLASDASLRKAMSSEIRSRMVDSILTNMDHYTRNLESALLSALDNTATE